jgi:hypothetical protein
VKSRSPARDRFEHFCFRVGAGLLARLPRGAAERLGRDLMRLYVRVAPSRRAILLENLRRALPEKGAPEIERLAGDSAAWVGAAFVEFLQVSGMSEADIRDRVRVSGEEHLHAARALGRGVFLLSAHFGGWELGAIRAGMIGEAISPVVRPLDNPHLEEELAQRRTRFGNRLIAKRDAARDIRHPESRNRSIRDQSSRRRPCSSFFEGGHDARAALFQLKTAPRRPASCGRKAAAVTCSSSNADSRRGVPGPAASATKWSVRDGALRRC